MVEREHSCEGDQSRAQARGLRAGALSWMSQGQLGMCRACMAYRSGGGPSIQMSDWYVRLLISVA